MMTNRKRKKKKFRQKKNDDDDEEAFIRVQQFKRFEPTHFLLFSVPLVVVLSDDHWLFLSGASSDRVGLLSACRGASYLENNQGTNLRSRT